MPCMSCKTMSIVVGSPFNDGPSGADPTIQSMTRHGDRLCSLHDLHGCWPFTHLHAFSWNLTDLALFALEDRQGLPCLAGLLNTNFQLFYHCLAGSCMLCCGPKVKTPLCVCCVVFRVWRAGVRFNRAGLWWGNLQIMVTAGGWETVGLSQGQSCLAQVGELGKVPNTN